MLIPRRELTPNVEALKMYDAAFPGRAAKCMGRCPRLSLRSALGRPRLHDRMYATRWIRLGWRELDQR